MAAGLAAVALPAAASANVQVGSSGWSWGNPLPQGNTLRAMAFSGATGYAVGDFGTLLETTDAGATWTGLPAGTFSNLTELQVLDASTLFAGGGCVARRSIDGGRTFSRIAFTNVESACPQDSTLAALAFLDQNFGYVFESGGQVFQTPDGGTRFAAKIAVPGTRAAGGGAVPTDAAFTSTTTGFVATDDGKMYETTDGANSWKPVSETGRAVRGIAFVSAQVGYAVGDQSLFMKTADGGATWTPQGVGGPAPQDLTGIHCATEDACVMTTRAGTQIIVTTDGGKTFTFPAPSTDPLFAAAFASATRLVAAGRQGSTTASDDAGANFTPIGGRLIGRFSRVRAGRVAGTAFAPGPDGVLGRTVDGGQTWTRGNVATSQDVLDVSFPTADDGYALDVAGGVFTTDDGGQSWKTLDTGSTARPNAVYAPSKSVVLVIGPTGVRRSVDGGGSFDAVRGDAVARTPLSDVDRAGDAIVAWGPQDVILSSDGGKTWRTVLKPGRYKTVTVKGKRRKVNRIGVRKVDFVNARTGFLLDGSGRVWRTTDGGRAWTERPGVGTDGARGMSFSNARDGYLVISRFGDVTTPTGFLLRTDDGGATWHPQFVESEVIPDGGVAAGAGTDYLLGGQQALLASTTGGDAGPASELTIRAARTKLPKPAHIVVTGKLAPASGNERVTVGYRRPGATRWSSQTVTVSANGSFTSSWNVVRGANQFVAQWQGNFRSRGDGSAVLTVTVGKGKRK
ncbi:MAG TPA: YCF48-related protein [Baekduia sp.]|uniref:WD40/YVTN/BNR-like repeat-containing protein n=1 Tax=Baekduia sp. TaxID=2600305 RepID=UPI002D793878|nr:YCF48-related protein [Baekduia sp.]HET6509734.1 YCF48-related protein [Baekduia sp.]